MIRYENRKLMDDEKRILDILFPNEPNRVFMKYGYVEGEGSEVSSVLVVGKYDDFPVGFPEGNPVPERNLNLRIIEIFDECGHAGSHCYYYTIKSGDIVRSEFYRMTISDEVEHHGGAKKNSKEDLSEIGHINILASAIAELAKQSGLEEPRRAVLERSGAARSFQDGLGR